MDQKIKRQWVKALRGGKYKQVNSYLYNGKGYCCLGVLGCVLGVPLKNLRDVGMPEDAAGYPPILSFEEQNELAKLNDVASSAGSKMELADGDYLLKEQVPFEMIAGLIDEAL